MVSQYSSPPYPSKNEIYTLALHECGHLISAKALGFQTSGLRFLGPDRYTKNYLSGSATIFLNRKCSDPETLCAYLRQRVQVLFSGALAETLNAGTPDLVEGKRRLEANEASDQGKAYESIWILRNMQATGYAAIADATSEVERLADGLWEETYRLIAENGTLIERLANYITSVFSERPTSLLVTEANLAMNDYMVERFPALLSLRQS